MLVIETDAPDARFELDGKVVADGAGRAELLVADPGAHQLRVTAKKRKPYEATVVVERGARVERRVTLERLQRAPAEKRPRSDDYMLDPTGNWR